MTSPRFLPVVAVLLASCASGPDAGAQLETRARHLMGTTCTITLPSGSGSGDGADAAADAAFSEIARIEALVSTWRGDSELSRINESPAGSAVAVSSEVLALLARAMEIADESSGAFTPLAGRLIELWDLRGDGRVPPAAKARAAADAIATGGLRLDRDRMTAARIGEVAIEEGGFAKGFALDRAIGTLRGRGVQRAILDFGGQIALYGFGGPVEVDIAHPEDRQRPAVRLAVTSGSISTSSGSETSFSHEGTLYSHLVDPRSGRALSPAGSATVLHEEALVADALSTALYVLGPREGLALADREGIAAIWLVPQGDGAYRVVRSASASALPLEIHDEFKTWKKEVK